MFHDTYMSLLNNDCIKIKNLLKKIILILH